VEALVVPNAEAVNRRRERRFRCLKSGRIVFNRGYAVFDCIIRNISAGGAMLDLETLGIPKSFELRMEQGNDIRPCDVMWRTGRRMGVAFSRAH
jgi:hypothetical protein